MCVASCYNNARVAVGLDDRKVKEAGPKAVSKGSASSGRATAIACVCIGIEVFGHDVVT